MIEWIINYILIPLGIGVGVGAMIGFVAALIYNPRR